MDQDFAQVPDGAITTLGRKSWTAYIGIALIGLLSWGIAVPLAWRQSPKYGVIVFVLIAAVVAYKAMTLRAVHLFSNDMGVWLYSGILPWRKGVRGVKWRDLDDATYSQSMWSWLSKSYSMRIGHRFTRSSEILLTNISRGDKAVIAINSRHQELARSNRLQ